MAARLQSADHAVCFIKNAWKSKGCSGARRFVLRNHVMINRAGRGSVRISLATQENGVSSKAEGP